MFSSRKFLIVSALIVGVIAISGVVGYRYTASPVYKGEKLARIHCASCHLFPEPELLDKTTWENHVIPQMAFRMGFKDNAILYRYGRQDIPAIEETLPDQPMVTQEELDLIRQYYIAKAPDSPERNPATVSTIQKQFKGQPVKSINKHFITMLKYDSVSRNLYIGNAKSLLYIADKDFTITDSIQFNSPPTFLTKENDDIFLSLVGRLFPSDLANGQLARIDKEKKIEYLIDSLKRAVHFERYDLNDDDRPDYIVCSFGNFSGALTLYVNEKDSGFQKHVLSTSPGARKCVVIDWNQDGVQDIVAQFAQGDERISVFLGEGDLTFREKILVRFPPVFGSSNFELADFNRDGFPDIITTHGDNGDFTNIPKNYHGVRIFENDQHHQVKEVWSFAMNGAWQAKPVDFDLDGDLDIAAISFFPDNKNHPERNFMYFENTGNYNFMPQLEPLSVNGVWMAMETADFDRDGDVDILIGSCRFQEADAQLSTPGSERIQVLLLDNTHVKTLR